jgi:EAL and modified HD-GYP domain-containing signal transduction protein
VDFAQFPLVDVQFVANGRNEWVALLLHLGQLRVEQAPNVTDALQALFARPDALAAIAPLDCVLLLDTPACLTPPILKLLPPNRVVFAFAAASLADDGARARALELHNDGYRVLLDGPLPVGVFRPAALRAVAQDCKDGTELPVLSSLFGPHLARGVADGKSMAECERAGFAWFSGDYPLQRDCYSADSGDAASKRRLLTLLALLGRDADSRELEALLKQDAALSFHLLKLVNSAAFAVNTQITSFGQAISLLGRRQLQRWLQLLLYARQQVDGLPNLLLPLAAVRGAQMEELARCEGEGRDAQDQAFMTGVFSLLDRLFGTPIDALVADLGLPPHVAAALLRREGVLGERLRLVEAAPDAPALEAAGIDRAAWWHTQLHGWHWAIQVGRNV